MRITVKQSASGLRAAYLGSVEICQIPANTDPGEAQQEAESIVRHVVMNRHRAPLVSTTPDGAVLVLQSTAPKEYMLSVYRRVSWQGHYSPVEIILGAQSGKSLEEILTRYVIRYSQPAPQTPAQTPSQAPKSQAPRQFPYTSPEWLNTIPSAIRDHLWSVWLEYTRRVHGGGASASQDPDPNPDSVQRDVVGGDYLDHSLMDVAFDYYQAWSSGRGTAPAPAPTLTPREVQDVSATIWTIWRASVVDRIYTRDVAL